MQFHQSYILTQVLFSKPIIIWNLTDKILQKYQSKIFCLQLILTTLKQLPFLPVSYSNPYTGLTFSWEKVNQNRLQELLQWILASIGEIETVPWHLGNIQSTKPLIYLEKISCFQVFKVALQYRIKAKNHFSKFHISFFLGNFNITELIKNVYFV